MFADPGSAEQTDYGEYPYLAGHYPLAGENQGLTGFSLWGDDYFAVCNEGAGLIILQVSGESLAQVGSIDVIGQEMDVKVSDWFGYVSTKGGLTAVSLASPSGPLNLGFLNLPGDGPRRLVITPTYAYVACGSSGLATVNTTNSAVMYVENWYGGEVESVCLDGTRLGITNDGRFELLDISTGIPALLGQCETVSQFDFNDAAVVGDIVYTMAGNQVDRWDFSDPSLPGLASESPFQVVPVSSNTRLHVQGPDLQVSGNSYLGYFGFTSGALLRETRQIWIARDIDTFGELTVTSARDALMIHPVGLRENPTPAGELDPTGFMNPKGIMAGDILYGVSLTADLTVTAADLSDDSSELWNVSLGFGSFFREFDHRGSMLAVLGGLPYEIRLVTASPLGATERGFLAIEDLNPTSTIGRSVLFFDDTHLAVLDTELETLGEPGRVLVVDVSDPDTPVIAHTYEFTGRDQAMYSTDSAILLGSNISVDIVDARDLDNLSSAGTLPLGAQFLFTKGDFLYAVQTAYYGARLETWDLSDPTAPSLRGEIPLARLQDFVVEGDFAYQAGTGLVLDLSDPGTPVPAGNFSLANPDLNGMERILAGGQYLLTGNTRSSAPFYPLHYLAAQGAGVISSVPEETPAAARSLALQASPNPFNPTVTLRFSLSVPAVTRIEVFDVRGRLVANLGEKRRGAGVHDIPWRGTDREGRNVSSGVYLARVRTDFASESLKIILTK